MQSRICCFITLSATLLAFNVPSIAQPSNTPDNIVSSGGPPKARGPETVIQRMDADKDSRVSRDEFKTYQLQQIDRRFNYLDSNKDGYITAQELQAARARFLQQSRENRYRQLPPKLP